VAYAGPIDKDELQKVGWLVCDGDEVKRDKYPQLFKAIGPIWGRGDNVKTFKLPDLRGIFLRGVNDSRSDEFSDPNAATRVGASPGSNTGNLVGSYQLDQFKSHVHDRPNDVYDAGGGQGGNTVAKGDTYGFGWDKNTFPTSPTGGDETRPKNAYVYYIIKF
jgi:hypothetical protein